MPRGNLKRRADFVGAKAARGGSSCRPLPHRRTTSHPIHALKVAERRARNHQGRRGIKWDDCVEEYFAEEYMHEEEKESERACVSDAPPEEEILWNKFSNEDGFQDSSLTRSEREAANGFNVVYVDRSNSEWNGNVTNVDFGEDGSQTEDSFSLCQDTMVSIQSYAFCDSVYSTANKNGFIGFEDTKSYSIAASVSEEGGDDLTVVSQASSFSLWEFVNCAMPPSVHSIVSMETEVATTATQISEPAAKATVFKTNATGIPPRLSALRQCAICLEEKANVVRMMHKCSHPAACRDCLQTYYLDQQMKDVSLFPLRCFWPGCDRTLRDVQIRHLCQGRNDDILYLYYHNECRARDYRREEARLRLEVEHYANLQERRVQHFHCQQGCPECGQVQTVYPAQTDRYKCCGQERPIDVISLSEIRTLIHEVGDWLVHCPNCQTLILKDGGCHRMECIVCMEKFDFREALKRH